MTMHRTKYCDRIDTFTAQMAPSEEYHAIKTSNFGGDYIAYQVTAKNGLKFYVNLYGAVTTIKCKVHENGKEVNIDVHPDKVIEGLDAIHQFFMSVVHLQGRLENENAA